MSESPRRNPQRSAAPKTKLVDSPLRDSPRKTAAKPSTPKRSTPSKKKSTPKHSTPKHAPRQRVTMEAVPSSSPSALSRGMVRESPFPTAAKWWHQIFLVGTEWNLYEKAFERDWDFSHLQDALRPGGELNSGAGGHVYVFGTTEPQYVGTAVETIPVFVAVFTDVPLSTQLALVSVQRKEELVDMSTLKMSWAPYVPDRAEINDRFVTSTFVLHCSERFENLRKETDANIIRFQYALPYVYIPREAEKVPIDTAMNLILEDDKKSALPPIAYDFREDGDIDDYLNDYFADNDDIPALAEMRERVIEAAKAAAVAKRAEATAERDRRRKMREEMPAEVLAKVEAIKCWKYYPTVKGEQPLDMSAFKSNYVNRYFGKAEKVI